MGFSPSLTVYGLFGRVLARGREAGAADLVWDARPPGRMIWLHAPRAADLPAVSELIERLRNHEPDLQFLLTTQDAIPDQPIAACCHAQLPVDMRQPMMAFLDHWHPDILVWIAGRLYPALTDLAAGRGIDLFLLDTGAAFEASEGWRLLPGLNRRTVRKFNTIFSGDEATSLALISAGARSGNVHTTGVLELGKKPPPCNEAEWTTLAALLATRPVWLAAETEMEELGSVLAAHLQALRRSHRLLLIVVPADIDAGDAFAGVMADTDIAFSQRSAGGEPMPSDQVYLADAEDEIGLWYRLAPVSFIGGTLAGPSLSSPDPFAAAALGSVVLHGPKLGAHRVAYHRLARAGASRRIAHLGELAHAVERLLSPDRAAVMAHAAWQISSAGAEVMDRTVEHLRKAVAAREADG